MHQSNYSAPQGAGVKALYALKSGWHNPSESNSSSTSNSRTECKGENSTFHRSSSTASCSNRSHYHRPLSAGATRWASSSPLHNSSSLHSQINSHNNNSQQHRSNYSSSVAHPPAQVNNSKNISENINENSNETPKMPPTSPVVAAADLELVESRLRIVKRNRSHSASAKLTTSSTCEYNNPTVSNSTDPSQNNGTKEDSSPSTLINSNRSSFHNKIYNHIPSTSSTSCLGNKSNNASNSNKSSDISTSTSAGIFALPNHLFTKNGNAASPYTHSNRPISATVRSNSHFTFNPYLSNATNSVRQMNDSSLSASNAIGKSYSNYSENDVDWETKRSGLSSDDPAPSVATVQLEPRPESAIPPLEDFPRFCKPSPSEATPPMLLDLAAKVCDNIFFF